MRKTIMHSFQVAAAMLLLLLSVSPLKAQSKTKVSIGADVVSSYIWRGQDLGGVSIQPCLTISKNGFFTEAWGTGGFDKDDIKEVNLTLGYETGGFTFSVTDYWSDEGIKYFTYSSHDTSHAFAAYIAYDFGPCLLSWETQFAGWDYNKVRKDGTLKRAYTSYLEAIVPFRLGGYDFTAEAGLTPWEGGCSESFNVVSAGIGVSKTIPITSTFSVPVFGKIIVNPNAEKTYFVFGISF